MSKIPGELRPGADSGKEMCASGRTGRKILMRKSEGSQEPSPTEEKTFDEAAPFQFLQINEPFQPPNKSHRHTVRTHVMRNFHSKKKKDKITSIKKPTLKKKGEQDIPPATPAGLIAERITNRSSPASPSQQEISTQTTLDPLDLSIISSAGESGTHSPDADPALCHQLIIRSATNPQPSPNFLLQFDRWLFNTSKDTKSSHKIST
jgi:hypothetical protein